MKPEIMPWPQTPGDRQALLQKIAAALRAGRLLALPTDTVYGLAAQPDHAAKLFPAKDRPDHKPLPLLIADIQHLDQFQARQNALSRRLADCYWPGPLTMVLATANGNEGFRIPDHQVTRAVLQAAGGALRVTSANLSGQPPALDAPGAIAALGGRVDLVLDAGPAPGGVASTVVLVEEQSYKIIREGAISAAQIEEQARAASLTSES
ncbi:MAG: L-threonylcarbamoyladenylate synthase [Kiritimatiellia bacterium]